MRKKNLYFAVFAMINLPPTDNVDAFVLFITAVSYLIPVVISKTIFPRKETGINNTDAVERGAESST